MGYLILIELLCSYKHPLSLWVNNLIHFYGCCKKIVNARKVFNEMPERTVVSWNSIMTACVESLSLGDEIGYFFRMWGCGFEPDETSMIVLLLFACVLQAPSIYISFLLFTNTIYVIAIILLLLAVGFNDLVLISYGYHNGRDTMYLS